MRPLPAAAFTAVTVAFFFALSTLLGLHVPDGIVR